MALDKAIEKHHYKHSTVCTVAVLLENLSQEDKSTLLNAIKVGIPTSALVRALRDEGHKMSDNSFNAHRQERCKCAKK